jgi:hypothetical protein
MIRVDPVFDTVGDNPVPLLQFTFTIRNMQYAIHTHGVNDRSWAEWRGLWP